jgi:hypothetical protein
MKISNYANILLLALKVGISPFFCTLTWTP